MATQINLNIDGNFLLVEDTSTGNITNYPLSFTSYQIFTPQNIDADSPDNKTYLFFTLLDGSTRKSGGYDIFCEGANYTIASVQLDRFFTSIQDLTQYLDNVVATPTDVYENPSTSNSYKVFTALLTQTGGDSTGSINFNNPFPLVIGTSYTIIGNLSLNQGGTDFTNVGAPNNDSGTSFIATDTTPIWGNEDGQLIFNEGAPVATVLKNNIGNIWFTYNDTGLYNLNSSALLPSNKTWCSATLSNYNNDATNVIFGYYTDNIIQLQTLTPNDQRYNNTDTSIEIRVYN